MATWQLENKAELVELILDSTHLESNTLGRKGKGVTAEEIVVVIPIIGAVLRIDHPNFRDTHVAIVFEFALETAEGCLPGIILQKRPTEDG
jgi:hypothetical protein